MTSDKLKPFRRFVLDTVLPSEWQSRGKNARCEGPYLPDDLRRLSELPRLVSSSQEAAALYSLKGIRPVSELHFELADGNRVAVSVQPEPMPGDSIRNGHASLMRRFKALSSAVYCLQAQRAASRSQPPGFHMFLITGFPLVSGRRPSPLRIFTLRSPDGLLFPGSDSFTILELNTATGIRPAGDGGPSAADDLAFFIANAHLEDRKGQIESLCDRREELKLAFYELPRVIENPDVRSVTDYMAEMDLQNAERILKNLRNAAADEREARLRMDLVLDLHRAGLSIEHIISVSRLPSDDVYTILNHQAHGAGASF
ncbi:MAG: hypothetical protein LBQ79_06325 [Deltaproteobacteria bacterium]|jgi:hypothetical protein|nr:hypothetical protein [Deltaproteobacteria bacterium]